MCSAEVEASLPWRLNAIRHDLCIRVGGTQQPSARPKYGQPGHVEIYLNLLRAEVGLFLRNYTLFQRSANQARPDGPSELSLNTEKTLNDYQASAGERQLMGD